MKIQKKDESVKLMLKVQTGFNEKGKAIIASRTVQNVNPAISEEDVYEIGKAIADLQMYDLKSVSLQETANLSE